MVSILNKKIQAILIDGHNLFRCALAKKLNENNVDIIAEAENLKDALNIIKSIKYHNNYIILTEMKLEASAIELLSRLKKYKGKRKVIAVSSIESSFYINRFIANGGYGYVSKNCSFAELMKAIEVVNDNSKYISEGLLNNIVTNTDVMQEKNHENFTNIIENFSDKEFEVLHLLINDENNHNDDVNHINISQKTLNSHRRAILRKLGLKTDIELKILTIQLGMIEILMPSASYNFRMPNKISHDKVS